MGWFATCIVGGFAVLAAGLIALADYPLIGWGLAIFGSLAILIGIIGIIGIIAEVIFWKPHRGDRNPATTPDPPVAASLPPRDGPPFVTEEELRRYTEIAKADSKSFAPDRKVAFVGLGLDPDRAAIFAIWSEMAGSHFWTQILGRDSRGIPSGLYDGSDPNTGPGHESWPVSTERDPMRDLREINRLIELAWYRTQKAKNLSLRVFAPPNDPQLDEPESTYGRWMVIRPVDDEPKVFDCFALRGGELVRFRRRETWG